VTDNPPLWKRLAESHTSELVVRSLALAVVLVAAFAIGGLGALVALVSGGTADDGFWAACVIAFGLMALAVAYLCWGGLREWLVDRRRR